MEAPRIDLAQENAALRQELEDVRAALAEAQEARSRATQRGNMLEKVNNLLDRSLFAKTVASEVLKVADASDELEPYCLDLFALIGRLVSVSWIGLRLSRQGHSSLFQSPSGEHPHGVMMLEHATSGRPLPAESADRVFSHRFGRSEAPFGHLIALSGEQPFSAHEREILSAICQEASATLESRLLIQLLREMASFQADFVNMLSHDLRNPLTGVISSLSTALMPGLPLGASERDGLLHTALDSAKQVNEMIGDLLDVAKLEAGRMTISRESVDLAAVIEKGLQPLKAVAQVRRIALVIDVPAGLPTVLGDSRKLQRVFANLVANALKYTPKGGVVIRLRFEEGHIAGCVCDTGLGIPPEAQSRLFEKFYQVAGRKGFGGTGLGLAFCRQMIEAHGGAIWVESPSDEAASSGLLALPESYDNPGTAFFFTLPVP